MRKSHFWKDILVSAQISVINSHGTQGRIEVNDLPDRCPWCYMGCQPKYNGGFLFDDSQQYDQLAQLVFQCPLKRCRKFFIVDYAEARILPAPRGVFIAIADWPKIYQFIEQPEAIKKISQSFCKIINQAMEAELHQLDYIAGPGYRKALEFLVKDYLISQEPANKEKVESMPLGEAIKQIADTPIKECSTRAAWLGNDETHYRRQWTNQDINDLKVLIKMTTNWIENKLLTQHYVGSMPSQSVTK